MVERSKMELDDVLASIAERTEDLSPRLRDSAGRDFVERVMMAVNSGDDLARLIAQTDELEPSAKLTERVMAAIRSNAAPVSAPPESAWSWSDNLTRTGLRVMAIAAAVAAACILFSTYAERSLDTRLISALPSGSSPDGSAMDAVEGGE